MSSIFGVYVGPYAEWLLSEEPRRSGGLVDVLDYESSEPDMMEVNIGYGPPPQVVRDGETFWRLCGFPWFDDYSDHKPPRKFHWVDWDGDGVLDLSDLDPKSEMA